MPTTTRERVPAHLRRFVVEQDYGAYNAIDQAVWRFTLLQMVERLKDTAHPAYLRGFAQAGMSVDRIPRIAEMDAGLSRFGWGAVCVDGFIPPRAFFELQAHSILPVAAEIRTPEHLAYTPAPDVIHEAAGHAPILPDPDYASFVRRIGEVGLRAFASRRDAEMYQAIYELSVVKERPDESPQEIARAEQRLQELVQQPAPPSEAALLSRLYWWTVEYGLVGRLEDYKLYGSGLLSSLGESHFCHAPEVVKLPLTPDCIEYDYDITRPQPQLFVARDLGELGEVLDAVSGRFAQRRGGLYGLSVAQQSGELARLDLDSGLRVVGRVQDVIPRQRECTIVSLVEPLSFTDGQAPLELEVASALLVVGRLSDGNLVHELTPSELSRRYLTGGRLRLSFRNGPGIEGTLRSSTPLRTGGVGVLLLDEARVLDNAFPAAASSSLALATAGEVVAVSAAGEGAACDDAGYSSKRAPRRAALSGSRAQLLALYERAESVYRRGHDVAALFGAIHDQIAREHPQEWLLRWNLLESLARMDLAPDLRERLVGELERLERHFTGRYPIASGLRYLGF